MADSSIRNAGPVAISSESSIWLWLFRPVAIAMISVGLVLLVAGITSFSIYGMASGSRVLLAPAGSLILSIGVLLGIGVIMRIREDKRMLAKARRSDNNVLDLTSEFATVEISMDSVNSVEIPGVDDQRNLQESRAGNTPRPPCYEDIVLASSVAPLPAVTSAVASEEVLLALEDPDQFEIPPSYEEAISAENGV
ncbi:uncharacterized protein LOC144651545 [Oculina patagonica]